MDHPNKKLFSTFPVLGPEFDLICIDAVKFSEDDADVYVPLVRFVMRDKLTASAGLTMRTGAKLDSLGAVAEFVNVAVSLELFLVDVSASGTIFDEKMEVVEHVDWNEKIKHVKEFNTPTIETKKYLH